MKSLKKRRQISKKMLIFQNVFQSVGCFEVWIFFKLLPRMFVYGFNLQFGFSSSDGFTTVSPVRHSAAIVAVRDLSARKVRKPPATGAVEAAAAAVDAMADVMEAAAEEAAGIFETTAAAVATVVIDKFPLLSPSLFVTLHFCTVFSVVFSYHYEWSPAFC